MFIVRYTYSNKHTYVERERERVMYVEKKNYIYRKGEREYTPRDISEDGDKYMFTVR